MWPVHAPGTPPAAGLVSSSSAIPEAASPRPPSDFFKKDGRKIRVGECALFQADNAPPFIGIIRWFSTGKADLKLGVNWLYRPADVKLVKGILLEAAPNEVFYSFHKDVIPAVSFLHPCKVAFLCKGVELPAGISSFVCRRVYDIANKCLWWLTDQYYINERQEEVDQLLEKTRLEMHAAVQSGGRSTKPLNGPTSTSQLKSGSDSIQNSGTSFPSQTKAKKRERVDQGTEPIKRERSGKTDDGDSVSFRFDNMIKAEIAKITERGGLVNVEAVEKLVHLVLLDRAERKIDLAGRILLTDVIASTDKFDCLCRFVQLRGLSVLDEWLQEAHKGKTGDGSSPKESDKSVEELLLALLCALGKLPVNLNALQTCNIGKSVNHLRSHKNLEIQRKARSLVDLWKKRVDAEIVKINDAKYGGSQAVSWPGKSGFSEVSQAGSRRAGSSELTVKSPITQPSTGKAQPSNPGHADAIVKSTPTTPVSLKSQSIMPVSVSVSSKDGLCKISTGAPEVPQSSVKEEKSSSSSQSLNNSQSCSSDHTKTMGSSWKEDARSSTTGSVNASKALSRHHRSGNGVLGTSTPGVQMETKTGFTRSITLDKVSQSGSTCDMPAADYGNSHRLIVRLPNPGRSPARSASGGSSEDPSMMGSRASSPGALDKNDDSDHKLKAKGDTCRANSAIEVNTESWQSNDVKEGPVGSDEGERSPTTFVHEECSGSIDEAGKDIDVSRVACSSSGNRKEVLLTEARANKSFISMNALIESCAKYSELVSAPLSSGDNIGMNLLASAAAGEMSKSDLLSPSDSPGPTAEDLCTGNTEAKSRILCDDIVPQDHRQSDEKGDPDPGKDVGSVLAGSVMQPMVTFLSGPEGKLEEDRAKKCFSASASPVIVIEAALVGSESCQHQEHEENVQAADSSFACNPLVRSLPVDENKSVACAYEKIAGASMCGSDLACSTQADGCGMDKAASGSKQEKLVAEETLSCTSGTSFVKVSPIDEGLCDTNISKRISAPSCHVEAIEVGSSAAVNFLCPGNADESKTQKSNSCDIKSHPQVGDGERKEQEQNDLEHRSTDEMAGLEAVSMGTTDVGEDILLRNVAKENHPSGATNHDTQHTTANKTVQCVMSSGSESAVADVDGQRGHGCSAVASSSANITGLDCCMAKLDFDLNEGILGDDRGQGEPVTSAAPLCSSSIQLPGPSLFASSTMRNGSPALITVAAPAKGPFIPPENLLKSKGEPGWKGSAATSAFRPAEPRKILEMQFRTSDVLSSDPTVKAARPLLDIDLNVPNERMLEDIPSQSSVQMVVSESGVKSNHDVPMRNSGALDLDLNRADEGTENGQPSTSTAHRSEVPLLPLRPASGGFSIGDTNVSRDFDLNDGPGLDEVGMELAARSQHARNSSVPFLSPIACLRMNNTELGNMSSWFPPSNAYPAVAIPSFLPDRGEQPYPVVPAAGAHSILAPVNGGSTFGGDVYRSPVFTSSPAMAFSHATAFPYVSIPFGSSFPIASTSFSGVSTTYVDSTSGGSSCYSAIPSQLVGPAAVVSSHYSRPCLKSLPEGGTSRGSESSKKWGVQGLDLNAGPGSVDLEGKDDRLSLTLRHLSAASSQSLSEEQARIYQMAGTSLKRKEPEGGWDAERFTYKPPTWQ